MGARVGPQCFGRSQGRKNALAINRPLLGLDQVRSSRRTITVISTREPARAISRARVMGTEKVQPDSQAWPVPWC